MDNRLIRAPKGYWTRCLREEFVLICDRNVCAAMVLSQHEYWHRHNLEQRKQARYRNQVAARAGQPASEETGLWCAMSHSEMKDELFGLFGDKALADAYKMLMAKGFLRSRANPNNKWDKKPQYLFVVAAVQLAADDLPDRQVDEPAEIEPVGIEPAEPAETTAQNCGVERPAVRDGRANPAESTAQPCAVSKNILQKTLQIIRQSRAPTPQPHTQPAQAAKDRRFFSSSQRGQRAPAALGQEQQRVNRSGAAGFKAALEAAGRGRGAGDG